MGRRQEEQDVTESPGCCIAVAALPQSDLPNQHSRLRDCSVLVFPARAARCPQQWRPRKHRDFTANKNVDLSSLCLLLPKDLGTPGSFFRPNFLIHKHTHFFSFSLTL